MRAVNRERTEQEMEAGRKSILHFGREERAKTAVDIMQHLAPHHVVRCWYCREHEKFITQMWAGGSAYDALILHHEEPASDEFPSEELLAKVMLVS